MHFESVSEPFRELISDVFALEAFFGEDDGAVVVFVADDAAHGLVDGANGLLDIPLVTA